MTSPFQPRKVVVVPSASRIVEGDGQNFIGMVNEGLQTEPLFRADNPHVIPYLFETYYGALSPDDEMSRRIGRVAAYYLQGMKAPFTDRRPSEIIKADAYMVITRSIARILNEQRLMKKGPLTGDTE